MKKFWFVSAAAGVLAVFFCGWMFARSPAFRDRSVTVRDSSGRAVTLENPAERIVSTVPSNTEILYALGLKDRVAGVTKYCAKTCDVSGKTVIGGWTHPDYEKIRGLNPDLIFAFGGIQGKHHDEFRGIAPTYCFDPVTVEQTLRVIEDIGRLTGTGRRAEEIVRNQRKILERVRSGISAVPPDRKLKVARVFGTGAGVLTAGGKSFLTDVIRLAGGENVFGGVDDDYFDAGFERIAALDPDVLIVHGEKKDADRKKSAFEKDPLFGKLKAVKNGKVFVYSCDSICHPNAAIADTVEMVARDLYPERFGGGPRRIISLGPSVTKGLYLLGAENRLIANTVYCTVPPEAKTKEKIGTVMEVNMEKAVRLNPDLVLATSLTDSKAKAKLKDLKIPVVTFSSPKNFGELCRQFTELGELVGKKEEAERIVTAAKKKADIIREKAGKGSKPSVIVQVGARPLCVATGDYFINDYIELAGGINAAKDAGKGVYSREQVLKVNPDVIVIAAMGMVGENERKIWETYPVLNAVKNRRIYVIETDSLTSPTPESFVETLEQIAAFLRGGEKS